MSGRTFVVYEMAEDGTPRRRKVYLDLADLDSSGSLETDAAQVAGLMGLCAMLLANATEQHDLADAEYRHWRGGRQKAGAAEGLPEWQARAGAEADKHFPALKRKIAKTHGDIVFLRLYVDALGAKMSGVRGRIEIAVSESRGTSIGVDPVGAERMAAREERTRGRSSRALSRKERVKAAVRRGRASLDEQATEGDAP